MRTVIHLDETVDINEFQKAVVFISQDICGVESNSESHSLIIETPDVVNIEGLKQDIEAMAKKFERIRSRAKSVFHITYSRVYYEDIYNIHEAFHVFEDGLIGLKGVAIFLFDYFDREFEQIAVTIGAKKKRYPVLLPVEGYKKTGYLHNSPQYAMFCSSALENMHELEKLESNVSSDKIFNSLQKPWHALSPSACFHFYIENQNTTLGHKAIFTFRQSVFRNEGRLNYTEVGRLRDYHVREIVFVGDDEFVIQKRVEVIKQSIELLKKWEMNGEILTAFDPFVLPKMQKFKQIQLLENSKYEVRLNVSEHKRISAGSYNLHGTAFTYPFCISVSGIEQAVTGCVGFGLERWVIAFISQYGVDPHNWPQKVKEEWDKENESIY